MAENFTLLTSANKTISEETIIFALLLELLSFSIKMIV